MKISFLMPAYNKESYIAESIQSFLDQSHRDKELIIIDDASTDGTESICKFMASKNKNIHYYKNLKNMGVAYSRNLAKQFSTGDIMCVLDADDIAYIQRAAIVNKFFTINKDIDIMYGGSHLIDISGKVLGSKSPIEFSILKMKENNFITHSTVAFRKSVDINYRNNSNFIDDWYFYLDCYSAGYKFDKVEIIIGAYRLDPEGLTYKGGMQSKSKEKLKDVLRKEFKNFEEDLSSIMASKNTQKERVRLILKDVPRETKVLDVGCNGGYIMSKLLKKNCSVIGIEKADNLIKVCQLKGLDVRNIDIFDVEQLDTLGLFDCIILGDILEHYNKDLAFKLVANFLNMLNKKGKLIITVPYKHGNYSTKFTPGHIENYGSEDFIKMLPSKEIKSMPICVDDYAVPYWEKVVISK